MPLIGQSQITWEPSLHWMLGQGVTVIFILCDGKWLLSARKKAKNNGYRGVNQQCSLHLKDFEQTSGVIRRTWCSSLFLWVFLLLSLCCALPPSSTFSLHFSIYWPHFLFSKHNKLIFSKLWWHFKADVIIGYIVSMTFAMNTSESAWVDLKNVLSQLIFALSSMLRYAWYCHWYVNQNFISISNIRRWHT